MSGQSFHAPIQGDNIVVGNTISGGTFTINYNESNNQCLADLRLTDPRDDKTRIEKAKGGLLKDSYQWILANSDFCRWQNDPQSKLLWIKGDPGKGKTMLLCGIINELQKSNSNPLSYFLCQATEVQLSSATAVLRGLIYLLVEQDLSLTSHIREKHKHAGKDLFEDRNSWEALSKILTAILEDPKLDSPILIIDALDECEVDLDLLLDFITQPSRAKWILSSRNWVIIEEQLNQAEDKVKLHLELNENSISQAVDIYIRYSVNKLAQKKGYTKNIKNQVQQYLIDNAKGTFLWVALVCQELGYPKVRSHHTLTKLKLFPPGLHSLYNRMLDQIRSSEDTKICMDILALVLVVYRPITLEELKVLVESCEDFDLDQLKEVIGLCGSFLTLQNNTISFVHQSAKDYLLEKAHSYILPSGIAHQHQKVFYKSLDLLRKTLKRDICCLGTPGYLIDQTTTLDSDRLARIRYSCVFWIDHLNESDPTKWLNNKNWKEQEIIQVFFEKIYLQWLEALSLLHSIPAGVKAIEKLGRLLEKASFQGLQELTEDARRFILLHKGIIEIAPLQVYASALLFSPTKSLIRQLFSKDEPDWIELKPRVDSNWNACLQTLEGHDEEVISVVFSNDGTQLVSGSWDKTIKIWDATSGSCIQTLKGHNDSVRSVVFSNNGTRLASGSWDKTIKIWDATSGSCIQTLEGHNDYVTSVVFSNNGTQLASGSGDSTIKIWDATSGSCIQTLEGHNGSVTSVVFSNNGTQLVSGSGDRTIKIWDVISGRCIQTLKGHNREVMLVVFSNNGTRLASGSYDKTIKIWDAISGSYIQTLKGHNEEVTSVVFSNDGAQLISGSWDKTIKIWDATSGSCIQTLKGHNRYITSVVFSNDGMRLASGSWDKTIKIWDTTSSSWIQTPEGHNDYVTSVVFSNNGTQLASGSGDSTIKIWDATSSSCIQTLEGHNRSVLSVVFSNNSTQLASGSGDSTIKIWDVISGSCIQTLKGHNHLVRSVVFSNNGTRLASGSYDKTIKIWDAISGKCIQTLKGHNKEVISVVFSNDGTQLISGSWDKTIKIWDATSGSCIQTLKGHNKEVTSVVSSNDGTRLASGSYDKTIKIWDATSGSCMQTISVGRTIYPLSFDHANNAYLSTELGIFDLSLPSNKAIQPIHNSLSHNSSRLGYGISNDCVWILKGTEKVLWLPPGYRPAESAIVGSTIAIGCTSDRVLIMRFR